MKIITSQCHPPSPTAFLTTPWRPTSTDFVRLLPVTTTLVWRGSTESSSSLLSPQLCNCEKPPLTELSTASSISVPTQWVEFHRIITNNNNNKKKKQNKKQPRWKLRNQNLKLHLFERSCIAHFVRVGFGGRRERNWSEIRGFLGEKKHSFFFFLG